MSSSSIIQNCLGYAGSLYFHMKIKHYSSGEHQIENDWSWRAWKTLGPGVEAAEASGEDSTAVLGAIVVAMRLVEEMLKIRSDFLSPSWGA